MAKEFKFTHISTGEPLRIVPANALCPNVRIIVGDMNSGGFQIDIPYELLKEDDNG